MPANNKRIYRSELFRHLDGIATAPTAYSLHKAGVLDFLLKKEHIELSDITAHFHANEGYLNVALRILASQGWLDYRLDNGADKVWISKNDRSETAFAHAHLYKDCVELLEFSGKFHPRKFEIEPFRMMEGILLKYQRGSIVEYAGKPAVREIQEQILKHIEGVLVAPTIVLLGMGGMFHKYFMEASFRPDEYHKDPESFGKILDFLTHLSWFEKRNGTYRFTEKGLFFAKRSSAYGVTVSYIPTFRKMDELLFGNPTAHRNPRPDGKEWHVDREMNVWGSGGAHSGYFKKIDEIIIDVFNRPINEQPRGILDMGCGNGAFLIHLFDVIERHTRRGKMLEEHPLFLVGVDYNAAALKVTRANLIKADIWAKVIWGDIGDPTLLRDTLKEDYDIELGDLLNVRTFLDHNRVWADPVGKRTGSMSGGAFASKGRRLSNADVEQNLREHLGKWMPYVRKHGLLLIELHTIPPEIAAQHIGRTAATAYDATHGFSDQYILEVGVFKNIAEETGLRSNERYFSKFPDSELATVSIHYLTGT